jgi:HAD superfamily hydrolase (TIGR01509 family)
MSPRVDALLIDLDNTLVDTVPALMASLADIGAGSVSAAQLAARTPREIIEETGLSHRWDEFVRHYLDRLRADVRCFIQPRFLTAWTQKNRLRIVTAAPRVAAEAALKGASCNHLCAFTIAREDALPKPSPTSLLLACERMRVAPGATLFVGDNDNDFHASLEAGTQFGHAVWGTPQPALTRATPSAVFTRVEEFLKAIGAVP